MVKAAGLGEDIATIARWVGRTPRTVRRWLRVFRQGGVVPWRGRRFRDGRRRPTPLISPPSRSRRDATTHAGLVVRRLDLGSVERLSHPADGGAPRPGLAAGAAASAALRLRSSQTLARPSPRPGRSGRLRAGPAGGGGQRWRPTRSGTNWPFEDETHLDTNPYLSRVWHRVGQQPTVPAAGTNRRLTVFGSVEAQGRGRLELLTAAGFGRVRSLPSRPGCPARGDGAADHPGAGQRSLPCQHGDAAGAGGARGVVGGDPPGPRQPPSQPERARVAQPQARPSRPPGRLPAGVRGRGGGRTGAVGRGGVRDHRRGAAMVDRRPPQGTDRPPPGRPKGAKDRKPRKRRARLYQHVLRTTQRAARHAGRPVSAGFHSVSPRLTLCPSPGSLRISASKATCAAGPRPGVAGRRPIREWDPHG